MRKKSCCLQKKLRSYCVSQVRYLNRSLTSGLFTNVNCAYMSNKLDKTGYLLYLRRTTVLFKNNSAWCAGHARGLKNAPEQLKIPLRGSDT